MGKIRRTFWAGIRTPWTRISDVVWERTASSGRLVIRVDWLVRGCFELYPSFTPLGIDGRDTHRRSSACSLLICHLPTLYRRW